MGQTLAQVPHSVQASGLIEYFSPSEIAPTGHSSIHVPQAIQSSLITYAIIFNFILLIILFYIHYSLFPMHHRSLAMRYSLFSMLHRWFSMHHRLLSMRYRIPTNVVAKLQLNSDIPTNRDKIFIVFPVFLFLPLPSRRAHLHKIYDHLCENYDHLHAAGGYLHENYDDLHKNYNGLHKNYDDLCEDYNDLHK